MVASTLPSPGTEFGPCQLKNGNKCTHRDCADRRRMAEAICPYCKLPIGWEQRFYCDEDQLMHAACLEDELERR